MADEIKWTVSGQGPQPHAPTEGTATLPPGSQIGKYQVVSVLGQGGFGITYRARDTRLGRDVAIKEYLPGSFAARQSDSKVLPHSTQLAEDFRWGRDRFLAEAKTLAQLEHAAGIVTVYDFLEANGTAYMVMALVPGETLEARLKRDGRLAQPALERLLYPLLDGLERVHQASFLHRDIKPANILIDIEGNPALIDFGASRVALQDRTQAMTAVFTPGYAAFEQISAQQQGPWTDIYALAGTLYHCIAGAPPPPSMNRMIDDRLVPAVEMGRGYYAPGLLAAIDAGLALKPEARPQSIGQWRTLFPGAALAAAPVAQGFASLPMARPAAVPRRRAWLWPAVAAAVVLCLAGGVGTVFVLDSRAREQQEAHDRAWVQAKATNTMAAYQEYLQRYPEGRFAAEARLAVAAFERQRVDEEAWTRARAANTEAGYRAYLDKYPTGRFAGDARREIERLAARPPPPPPPSTPAPPPSRQVFRDCEKCPEMIPVARGSFVMGAAPGEEDREGVEPDARQKGPLQRRVAVNDFALGKFPVTRGEFAAFVAATGYNAGSSCTVLLGGKYQPVPGRSWQNALPHQDDRHPVVCVTVTDAQAYAAWLAKHTGKPYRLPSEAEWEYAARAGTTTTRYWGNDRTDACKHQNVPDFSMTAGLSFSRDNTIFHCVDGNIFTSAVDAFPANPWGFHDMLGNVYQRLSDCRQPTYEGAPADGRSWEEGGDCTKRAVRGGAWWGRAAEMRAAARAWTETARHTFVSGFRVARGN